MLRPANDLERVAHAWRLELKSVPGTREVQTTGGPGRAVHVWLDPMRLRERGVDVMGLKAPWQRPTLACRRGRAGACRSHDRRTRRFGTDAHGGNRRIPDVPSRISAHW
jgi:multidrug efflux pump subunit AcrB